MAENSLVSFGEYLEAHPEAGELIQQVRCHYRLPLSDRRMPGNRLDAIPGYLGRGVDKDAFRVGEHVLKLVHPRPARSFEAQVRPMKKALGVEGAEQLIASSAWEAALVTHHIDGVVPGTLSAQGLARYITLDSMNALDETIRTFQERGLYVDSPSNILVTRRGAPRFVIIDPLDSPRDAVNSTDLLMNDIASWQFLPEIENFTMRPPEDVAYIRNTFLAVRSRGR